MGCGSSKNAEQPKGQPIKELKTYTMEDVQKCNKPDESMLIALEGNVYAPFPFICMHPGGGEILAKAAGRDVTDEFDSNPKHSTAARKMLKKFLVGILVGQQDTAIVIDKKCEDTGINLDGAPSALRECGNGQIECTIIAKKQLSHNSFDFTFSLPSPNHVLGLPVGQHVRLVADIRSPDGTIEKDVTRSYTPVSPATQKGTFKVVIKVYYKNAHPEHPEGGQMTQYIDSLKIGDRMQVVGPQGAFVYQGQGTYTAGYGENRGKCSKMGFVCGGTGISPAYQVIQSILSDATDTTNLWLVYSNQSESDILLREELDKLAEEHPTQFKLWYTVTQAVPEGWAYGNGRVTEEMLAEHMPDPGEDTLVTACGPPGMIEDVVVPSLARLGHADARIMVF